MSNCYTAVSMGCCSCLKALTGCYVGRNKDLLEDVNWNSKHLLQLLKGNVNRYPL